MKILIIILLILSPLTVFGSISIWGDSNYYIPAPTYRPPTGQEMYGILKHFYNQSNSYYGSSNHLPSVTPPSGGYEDPMLKYYEEQERKAERKEKCLDKGNEWYNNKCYTHEGLCVEQFGKNATAGDPGKCMCKKGYKFDYQSSTPRCVFDNTKQIEEQKREDLKRELDELISQLNALQRRMISAGVVN